MTKFPGQGKTYLSADSVAEEDLNDAYPTDFLNSITLSGMLPHVMTLKVGAPVIFTAKSQSWLSRRIKKWNMADCIASWRKSHRSRNCQWGK